MPCRSQFLIVPLVLVCYLHQRRYNCVTLPRIYSGVLKNVRHKTRVSHLLRYSNGRVVTSVIGYIVGHRDSLVTVGPLCVSSSNSCFHSALSSRR
ncbi:hypothetical protein EDB86DRAFT_1842509 [Lactarius hatsudake]|nr:hypothetical protein EDB86DRAFT_1842509 [Lactarius hatsudake]